MVRPHKPVRSVMFLYEKYVGKKAMVTVLDRVANQNRNDNGLVGIEFPGDIHDARTYYGVEQVLVTAVGGCGSGWVSADNARVVDEWPNETNPVDAEFESDEPPGVDPGGAEESA